jgi:signal transduction histidine kinase
MTTSIKDKNRNTSTEKMGENYMADTEMHAIGGAETIQFSFPESSPSPLLSPILSPGIVHDLGNLILVAASALNIVSRNSRVQASSDLEPVVTSAKISLQRATELVQQTIRFARDDTPAGEVVSLSACLAEIENLVENTWKSHIRVEFETTPDLPVVTCNRLNLQCALMNLLFNARDAMPDGGVISVRAAAVYDGQVVTEIDVRITDNGVGMTRETMLRASDPFFTTKTLGLGGLGLPMVMSFVQEAGGRLHIESERDVGTIVMLRLPASNTN